MTEIEKQTESTAKQTGQPESDRTETRRLRRESRRPKSRSTAMRRKPSSVEITVTAKKDKKETEPQKKAPSPRKSARRPSKKTTVTTAKKKKSALSKPVAKKTTAKRKAQTDDGFELRSQPDGTLLRVKVDANKKTKPRTVVKRKTEGAAGPGPAIVDMSSVSLGIWTRGRKISKIVPDDQTKRTVDFLKDKLPVRPEVAVILGSGLSGVADIIDAAPISFSEIPGFEETKVPGHLGRVRAGLYNNIPALFCEGRRHYYETGSMRKTVFPIKAFIALGVQRLILTASAGAINSSYKPGDIMFVKDHINLMGDNPLFGMDPTTDPSIFVDCGSVYEESILSNSGKLGRTARIRRRVGVLAGTRGPVYETQAERAWLKSVGADAVCMSIVPEAIFAAYLGVPVTALCLITNQAAPRKKEPVSHEMVVSSAREHSANLKRLIAALIV